MMNKNKFSVFTLRVECDFCARRATRLKYAWKQLHYIRKKYSAEPNKSHAFFAGATKRYVEEILASHPEHPLEPEERLPPLKAKGEEDLPAVEPPAAPDICDGDLTSLVGLPKVRKAILGAT
jgi:hypothetical protein